MQQRAATARALALALSPHLIVTHDPDLASRCTRQILIAERQVV